MKAFKIKLLLFCSLLVACHCFEDKTVLQYLDDNGFSLLVRLLTEAKLDIILNGTSPHTILAPTNAAIAMLNPDTMVTLSKNTLLLKTVMQYHVLGGYVLIPEFQTGKDETTLNGQVLSVEKDVNNSILFNNQSTITQKGDIILNNGVVHPIDTVLIPPLFSTNNLAAELIIRDDLYSEFLFSLLITNMTVLLENGEYTIFAPTDAAFTAGNSIFYRGMPNAGHFYFEMLHYHIVPGARASNQLTDGQVLYTLHGTPIKVNVTSNGVYVDNAKVIEADIGASNGVIHGIDKMLFPDDLRTELETLQQQQSG